MAEQAPCSVQQDIKITGCFILVSGAAKRLVKHVAMSVFPRGEFQQGSSLRSRAGWTEGAAWAALCS